jgi:ribose transport system permease protein
MNVSKKNALSNLLEKYDRYLVLILFVVVSTIMSDKFFTVVNISNLLKQNAAVGIVAMGEFIVILTGGIDLSVGGITSMCCIICALLQKADMAWPLAALISILCGILAGMINGSFVAFFKMVPFVVTLATYNIFAGMALLLSKGRQIFFAGDSFLKISTLTFWLFPLIAIIWFIIAYLTHFMLDKTPTGRYIRGIGGNREAIRLSGVNIKYIEILAYVVAGFLSAIGGIIMASRLTLGSNSVGDGWELTAIAAVMIGGASPTGGIGKVGGVIVGTLVMGLMVNIMNLVGISIYWQQIIKGVIIIVAVFTNSMRDIKEKG